MNGSDSKENRALNNEARKETKTGQWQVSFKACLLLWLDPPPRLTDCGPHRYESEILSRSPTAEYCAVFVFICTIYSCLLAS